jgi:hypothetical protein
VCQIFLPSGRIGPRFAPTCGHPNEQMDIVPGARMDTNAFSSTAGPPVFIYRNTETLSWILDHCGGVPTLRKPSVPL